MKNPIVSMRSDADKCMGIIFFTVDFPDFSVSHSFIKIVIDSEELIFPLDKEKATFENLRQFRYIYWIDQSWKKRILLKKQPYPKHYLND